MKRPSKKEIKAALDELKSKKEGDHGPKEPHVGKPVPPKNNKRIRKQGV